MQKWFIWMFVWWSFGVVACIGPRQKVRRPMALPGQVGLAPSSRPPTLRQRHANRHSPFAHVVLLNGGNRPEVNFYSHLMHLKRMLQVLRLRQVPAAWLSVLASDGSSPKGDLLKVTPMAAALKRMFRFRSERIFFEPLPLLINTTIPGQRIMPATREQLERVFSTLGHQLRLRQQRRDVRAHRPVLLFVTDHGERNRRWSGPRNQKISLWHESLTVQQLDHILRPLGRRRVIYVMSQCFSGSFAWSIYPRAGVLEPPDGSRCGFFSTTATRYAYGCYAETQKSLSVGHAHRFISAMRWARTMTQAHRWVLLTDQTPDVPLRSSDSFLRALLVREAKRVQIGLNAWTSQWLARYQGRGAALLTQEQELINALARRFSLPRPRSFRELLQIRQRLHKQRKFRKAIEAQWKGAYRALRDELLAQWYRQHPGVQARIKAKYERLMRSDLSPQVFHRDPDVRRLARGFSAALAQQPEAASRLALLERRFLQAKEMSFWLEVQAAVLLRMTYLYYRMAGRLFLRFGRLPTRKLYQRGLQRLLQCEATSLGLAPDRPLAAQEASLPVLRKDPNTAIPLILGVAYRHARHKRILQRAAGAIRLTSVGMNTPAERAGLQPGDYILSLNRRPLLWPDELRERVMLAKLGAPFVLRVLRDGREFDVAVRLQPMKRPDFVRPRPLLGKKISTLSSLRPLTGQPALPDPTQTPTLLLFWATWCGPCKMTLPTLRKWHQRFGPKGLKIVAVSKQAPALLERWYQAHPKAMPFQHAVDPRGKLSLRWGIFAIPTLVLLYKGKVVFVHRGAWGLQKVARAISKCL